MLGTEADTTTLLAPTGFCPCCDYPMDAGTCPECGLESDELQLRRRPKPWWHRHWRRVAAGLCALTALVWFANARIDWIKLFPTSYLLSIHEAADRSSEAAAEELAARYLAGELSTDQTQRFVRQCVDVTWIDETGSPNRTDGAAPRTSPSRPSVCQISGETNPRALPFKSEALFFKAQEAVLSVRVGGENIPLCTSVAAQPTPSEHGCAYIINWCCDFVFGPTTQQFSFGGTSVYLLYNSEQAPMSVEVDTVVVVDDDLTGREIARWPLTHKIEGATTGPWPAELDQVLGNASW